jgi:TatD DNase family protein
MLALTQKQRWESLLAQWIDTHAHLDSGKFGRDREAVIARAREVGVWPIVTVGADLASSRSAVMLAEQHAGLYATVGVHPHSASGLDTATVDELRELAAHPCVVAVGEIGLDYYYEFSPREQQREAFAAQLALASEVCKPVVVHLRDKKGAIGVYELAGEMLADWLAGSVRAVQEDSSPAGSSPAPGVLHCFSGTLEIARAMIELGFYLGVDGPVTFPSARGLQTMVAELPLERLVLETDCPYLAPQARRGKRNEPAFLPYVGEKVAELQGIKAAHVAKVTCRNAARLFLDGSADNERCDARG